MQERRNHFYCVVQLRRRVPVGHLLRGVQLVHDSPEVLRHAGSDVGHTCVVVQVRVRVIVLPGDVLVAVMLRVKMVVAVVVDVTDCVRIQQYTADTDARGVDWDKKVCCLGVHDEQRKGLEYVAGVIVTQRSRSKFRIIQNGLHSEGAFMGGSLLT